MADGVRRHDGGRGGHGGARLAQVVAAVALWQVVCAVAECTVEFSLPKCEQLQVIGKALGKEECQFKRDYYRCLRSEGCYDLPAGCLDVEGLPISCREVCEAEPGFYECVDRELRLEPDEDYHLCPHITKALAGRRPPSAAELSAATPLPFTVALWTTFDRAPLGLYPESVVPLLMPTAADYSLASILGLHQEEVVVEEPLAYRGMAMSLDGLPFPPAWAEQTTFFVFTVLAVNNGKVEEMRAKIVRALVIGEDGSQAENLTSLEALIRTEFNHALPQHGNLTMTEVKAAVASGRTEEFPIVSTTAPTTTRTTTVNPALVLRLWEVWRLRCVAPVVYRWEVFEIQLFADGCPAADKDVKPLIPVGEATKANVTASGLLANSSGSLADADGLDFGVMKAFDGTRYGTNTSWVSACRGCDAGEAWLDLQAGPGAESFSANCLMLRQGESPTGQCAQAALEVSANASNASSFVRRGIYELLGVEVIFCIPRTADDYPLMNCGVMDDGCGGLIDYGSCPGYGEDCWANRCKCMRRAELSDDRYASWQCGVHPDGCDGLLDFGSCEGYHKASCVDHICIEEDPVATRWRLVCASGLLGRWWIRELEFHAEGLCQLAQRSFRGSTSSGTFDQKHPMLHAFDGREDTFWASQCSACLPGAAWLGVDFGEPVKIACVRLVQDSRTTQRCSKLVLQYSDDGLLWINRFRYGFGGHVIGAVAELQADMDTKLDDEQDLQPLLRSATFWRLVCATELRRQWGIHELEFFDDEACSVSLRSGISKFLSAATGSYPVENAFDFRLYTLWKTRCGRCDAGSAVCSPCAPSEAYIGAEFAVPVNVKCIRIRQLELARCPEMHLQFSLTAQQDSWTLKGIFEDAAPDALLRATTAVAAAEASQAHRAYGEAVAAVFAPVFAILALEFRGSGR